MTIIKKPFDEISSQITRFRISLASRNPKVIEKASVDLLARANTLQIKIKGPIRLPTRTLKHTTRKSPCGNGSNTWDAYEMKIYKRVIDLYATKEGAREAMQTEMPTGVDVSIRVQ